MQAVQMGDFGTVLVHTCNVSELNWKCELVVVPQKGFSAAEDATDLNPLAAPTTGSTESQNRNLLGYAGA